MDYKKILLLINDIGILVLNIILCVNLFKISDKEKEYRGTNKLYTSQIYLIIFIIAVDIIMNIKNVAGNYRGHNKYGMLTRFFMFYLIIPCVVLTYQKSSILNHEDMQIESNKVLYMGCIIDGLIILSMILSFVIIDKQGERKILVHKKRNSVNRASLENYDDTGCNQIFQELQRKIE